MGVLGFDFGFRVSETCLFLCSSLMRFFVIQIFHFSGLCVASEEVLMCSLLLHSSILLTE